MTLAHAVGYAAFPAAALLAGGLLAERFHLSLGAHGLLLHGVAGIVVGVFAVELLPSTLAVGPAWLVLGAFVAGGLVFLALDAATHHVAALLGARDEEGSPWMLALGIGLDLFTDGLMVGLGATFDVGLALLLGLALVAVDLPEGFAAYSALRKGGVGRKGRLSALGVAVALVPLAGALGWIVRDWPDPARAALLAATAGILATLLVEEIVPQSHEGAEGRYATGAFLGGFALFAALYVVVG